MDFLTKDQIRQRLRVMLYQDQLPISRIAKNCGMDSKTIELAKDGEMTERTVIRFTRWFYMKDKGVETPSIRENFSVLPTSNEKLQLVNDLGRLFQAQKIKIKKTGVAREKLLQMKMDELALLFVNTESRLKHALLRQHEQTIRKFHVWLYDKWDYWQWEEKIQLILTDIGK